MSLPSWLIPCGITIWMALWVYLGYRNGNATIMQMRAVGAVLLSLSVWLIWWLTDDVRYLS